MKYLDILRNKTTCLLSAIIIMMVPVDFDDLAFVLNYWLESCGTGNNCIEADLNSSGTVSFDDFANCAQDWTGN